MTWPETVEDDITIVRNQLLAYVNSAVEVDKASSLDELETISFDNAEGVEEAVTRVLLGLNLPADALE